MKRYAMSRYFIAPSPDELPNPKELGFSLKEDRD